MSQGGPVDPNVDLRPRVEALEARAAAVESRQLRAEHQLGEIMIALKEHEKSTHKALSELDAKFQKMDDKIQRLLNVVLKSRPGEEKVIAEGET